MLLRPAFNLDEIHSSGGFDKPIYSLGQALTLSTILLHLKTLLKKFGIEHKMAPCPTFSLDEIDLAQLVGK